MKVLQQLTPGFLALAVVLTGCGGTGTPGGPGKTDGDKSGKTILGGPTENTFTVDAPGSVTLKQGESKMIRLALKRGKNFGEDVALKLQDLPTGVTIEPS